MRILVFSDSHGAEYKLSCAIGEHPEAQAVIHLGDGERDVDACRHQIGDRRLIQVCGNCDFYSMLPVYEFSELCGKRIFCTHGHMDRVKNDPEFLISKAKNSGADILLYGHTHNRFTEYRDGMYIMNPGSIRNGEFGAIDIMPSGIVLLEMDLK